MTFRDPTSKVQSSLQKMLSDIFSGLPPSQKKLYYRLLCTNGSAPAIYGLPKIHKIGTPLRPIVDYTRSPLFKLSGYLHKVLAPLVGKSATHIKNSQDFIENIKDVTLDENDILVSFDVCSLFTSVPVELAVHTCKEALKNDPSFPDRMPLEVGEITELLRFCLANTYFVYNGTLYEQIFGTAMGASISVTAANLTMEAIESKALNSFKPRPKVFLRYVDDCFCILNKQNLQSFLDHLNATEPSINFTVEEEMNGSIPFLDINVKRAACRLSFSVFRKPTHSGRYLDFESSHPLAHKRSVISSLLNRARNVCADPESFSNELKVIKKDLERNGYPRNLVNNRSKNLQRTRGNEMEAQKP
ncbi:hypothetical protein V5799_020483 [Amblyomma americanum]|uniref:Reverse transcriptase domain-containing protein n=1 Tax=Amblyomma americanum TaxID=6943 RepID=A0AAQ4ETZ2_AMBAM